MDGLAECNAWTHYYSIAFSSSSLAPIVLSNGYNTYRKVYVVTV